MLDPTYIPVISVPCREEYGKLFDFVNAKKLNIKNRGLKEVLVSGGGLERTRKGNCCLVLFLICLGWDGGFSFSPELSSFSISVLSL